ncbi:adenosylcobinamide-GDP ribazoletransferase [Intestinibacter sp.]|uniref:adenosylcobinamide-GDP ribazoletransferase n=1 Tax=Intestinibacter sp. TaxID=1965304 RepID=UPI003F18FF0E
MNRFISILQFLTRIPIRIETGFDEEFHKSIVYFPLVGFVIGLITYVFGWFSLAIFDSFVSAIVITLIEVLTTGGLHIDGLGDTFDALYSNRDKERILEIMKDSRLGTNSLLAIMFLILLKIGFINCLIQNDLLWIVIFMPVVARIGAVIMTYKTVTPRAKGMGNLFIGKGTMNMIITSVVYSSALIVVFAKLIFLQRNTIIMVALSSILFIIVFALLFKNHVYKKIDGITGDILGCTIELGEVFYLIYTYLLIALI